MDILVDIKNKFYEMKLLSEELDAEEGQSIEINIPAYGARLVALSMSQKEQDKLMEDTAIEIFDDSAAEIVMFKSRGATVETIKGEKLLVPEYVKHLQDNNRYLVLVVNTTEDIITTSLTVKVNKEEEVVEDGLTMDKVVGTYSGRYYDSSIDSEDRSEYFNTITVSKSGDGLLIDFMGESVFNYDSDNSGWARTKAYNGKYGVTVDILVRFYIDGDSTIRMEGTASSDDVLITYDYVKTN